MSDVERRKKDLNSAIGEYREAIVDEAHGNGIQEALRANYENGSEGAKAMDEAIDAAERWTP